MPSHLRPVLLLSAAFLVSGCDWLDARRAHHEAETHLVAQDPAAALPPARRAHELAPGNTRYLHTYTETQRQLLRRLRRDLEESPSPLARLRLTSDAFDRFEDLVDADTSERLGRLRADARAETLGALDTALHDLESALALPDHDLENLAACFSGSERPRAESVLARLLALRQAARALDQNDLASAANRLDSLPADFAAAAPLRARLAELSRQIDEAIAEADRLASEGRFREAHAALDDLASRHAWRPDLRERAERILVDGAAHNLARLQAALSTRDRPALQTALDDLAWCRRTELPITADELLDPPSFSVFVQQLQSTGLAPAAGSPRSTVFDLVLCAGLRSRFPDAKLADAHLADGYLWWASDLASRGRHRLAAIARRLAVRHGATVPAAPSPASEAAEAPRLSLVFSSPANVSGQSADTFLSAADVAARTLLVERLGPFLPARDEQSPGHLAIPCRVELRSLRLDRTQKTKNHEARYLSGQRVVPNPAYDRAKTQAANALADLNQARARAESAARQASLNRSISSLGGNNIFGQLSNTFGTAATNLAAADVTPYQNAYNLAQQRLAATPPTIAEDVHSTHVYPEITHHLVATAEAVVVFQASPSREIRLPLTARFTHDATEFRGDPAKGGKVQAPNLPSSAEIETALAKSWSEQLSARAASLVDLGAQAAVTTLRSAPFPSAEDRLEIFLANLVGPLAEIHPELAAEFSRAPDLAAFFGALP